MKSELFTFFDSDGGQTDAHVEMNIYEDDDFDTVELRFFGDDAEGSIVIAADTIRPFAKFLVETLEDFEQSPPTGGAYA